jgi:hypothetical protein
MDSTLDLGCFARDHCSLFGVHELYPINTLHTFAALAA